jgi:hypothetical protein
VNQELSRTVWERAADRCEYCALPQFSFPLRFQIDHVRAEKHGGATIESNLALACAHCNRHKGPNLAGFDDETGQIVRLFNPRTDIWDEHFAADRAHLRGKTAIGRVTVDVLGMNSPDQLFVRNALLRETL